LTISLACRLLHALAAVVAVGVAFRRREHRPIAWLLALSSLADFTRWGLGHWLDTQPAPHTGIARVGHHVDQALYIAWPIGIAAACWRVYVGKTPYAHALAYVLVLAGLVVGYPWPLRGDVMRWGYTGIHAVALIASLVALIVWVKMRAAVQIEHRSALLILAAETALFTGPLFPISPDPFRRWALAQWSYAFLYLILTLVHWNTLWSSSSRISPSPVRSSRAH
jgi:hypothetical protein